MTDECFRFAEVARTGFITMKMYAKHGKYHEATPQRRFGSWNKAVMAAGLKVAIEKNYNEERLIENMMRMWEHYGRQPLLSELARLSSEISGDTYSRPH